MPANFSPLKSRWFTTKFSIGRTLFNHQRTESLKLEFDFQNKIVELLWPGPLREAWNGSLEWTVSHRKHCYWWLTSYRNHITWIPCKNTPPVSKWSKTRGYSCKNPPKSGQMVKNKGGILAKGGGILAWNSCDGVVAIGWNGNRTSSFPDLRTQKWSAADQMASRQDKCIHFCFWNPLAWGVWVWDGFGKH